jgi:SAM-dependent methyltransferase
MGKSDWPEWHCPVHCRRLKDRGDVLVCPEGECFRRRDGIPYFGPQSNYAAAFGIQWKKYRLTQLDSYTRTTMSRDRARRCLGEELWAGLAGKQILECGCGAGRFTEILLDKGAYITSIDLSDAVDANQENFPQNGTHRVAQADIQQLPFAPQQFDVVFCLGVVQHTPSPEKTVACLYEQIRPGGSLIIDHFTHSLSLYTKTAPLFRRYLCRLSPEEGMRRTEWLVDHLFPLHRMARHFRPAQMLLSRFSPVLCGYNAYPEFSDDLQREWALLDTHDSLTARYAHIRSIKQIRRILECLGLQEIWCNYGGNGVEARGKRPLP